MWQRRLVVPRYCVNRTTTAVIRPASGCSVTAFLASATIAGAFGWPFSRREGIAIPVLQEYGRGVPARGKPGQTHPPGAPSAFAIRATQGLSLSVNLKHDPAIARNIKIGRPVGEPRLLGGRTVRWAHDSDLGPPDGA